MWNTQDQRAVVPPAHMLSSRDVLQPSGTDACLSSYPLGMGIYRRNAEGASAEQVALFYVSPVVAADRAPSAHMGNAAGVEAGWYAMVEPGQFEVRITRVNEPLPCTWPENLLTTHLFIDGVCTNDSRIFHESRQVYGESVLLGFVERMSFAANGAVEKDVRRFEFGKARAMMLENGGMGEGNDEAATICLETMVGVGVYTEDVPAGTNEYGYEGRGGVSEREMTKEGKSLAVRVDGDKIPEKRSACKYRAVRERPCPEASVTVFVRERSWMRARRLVDDNGEACTYEGYLGLMEKDLGVHGGGGGGGGGGRTREAGEIERRERRKKRRVERPVVIELSDSEGEGTGDDGGVAVIDLESNVIDLT